MIKTSGKLTDHVFSVLNTSGVTRRDEIDEVRLVGLNGRDEPLEVGGEDVGRREAEERGAGADGIDTKVLVGGAGH